jgi:Ca2+-binding EF-hand superfamily protein
LKQNLTDSNSNNDETYQTIDQIWGRYDKDNSGELDKLETLNFLNEFLSLKNKPSVTIEEFNKFFKKFDVNGDNMIEKSEMARFVR